jgi:hypothetical protein
MILAVRRACFPSVAVQQTSHQQLENMASQLLPLGTDLFPISCPPLMRPPELVDKCVGSRIWVVMKSEKGTVHPRLPSSSYWLTLPVPQNSAVRWSASMTTSVSFFLPIFRTGTHADSNLKRYGSRGCDRVVRNPTTHHPSEHDSDTASEPTGEQNKLPKILLNGNNICMVCPIPALPESESGADSLSS